MKKLPLFLRSFRAKVTLFFVLAMVFAGATSNLIIYHYALDAQFEQLRGKLMAIAQTSALEVDGSALASIPLERRGTESPDYKIVVSRLSRIKKAIPSIKYLYVLAKTNEPKTLAFVADADAGDAAGGQPSYPGDKYDASRFPEMLKAFSGPAADRALGKDEWGVFLSGYAPVLDDTGRAVAILGVDMKAEDVYGVQKEVGRRAAAVFGLGILLAVALGVLISGSVTKQIRELMKGAERIAKGDLGWKVKVRGVDEIAHLAHLFNKMSVDLKRHIEELRRTTAEKERLMREIEIARGIQQGFLPESVPQLPGIEIAAVSLPARVVGGDFYDFIPIDKDRWGMVIADVSGKGVPAALFMALSRTLVRASASGAASPADAVNHANELIIKDSKTTMFVTLFYAILDAKAMTLRYANAGHNPPLHISGETTKVVLLQAQGVPLGITSDIKATNDEIALHKGDIITLYTDGVTEAINGRREQFEMERLEKVVMAGRGLSAEGVMARIREELVSFVGDQPQFDDITMMVIKAA